MKFNQSARRSPFFYSFFLMNKFEKYQRTILGPSSPDSVAIFEKKLGKTFYLVFLSQPKKWIVDQNKINLGEKTEEVTLV